MSPVTNEIKCYICMISCIFVKQIFMIVYTECMYVSSCLMMTMKNKTVFILCAYKYTVFIAFL